MNIIIKSGFVRISKAEAKKRYEAGETVRICACNMAPDNPYGAHADANIEHYTRVAFDGFNITVARDRQFDTVVESFQYYNCNNEAGRYPAFYVKECDR